MPVYGFEKQIKITYPECDIHNLLKLSSIMRHIQEISGEHLEALGLHHTLLWEEGFVYLLVKVGLRIARRPAALETITMRTQPRNNKGVQLLRDVYFIDESGETILTAETAWVLTDPVAHHIRRPAEFPHTIPVEPTEVEHEFVKAKLRRPEQAQPAGIRCVHYSDLDCNFHMNNAIYSDIVCDFLPLERHKNSEMSTYCLSFVGEITLGDEITVYTAQMDENTYYVGADRPAGDRCFEAIITY